VGIVHRPRRGPHRARLRGPRIVRDRVGQGRDTASEPDPDIGPVPGHRLEHGDRAAWQDRFPNS
jgi:hypothetical protein